MVLLIVYLVLMITGNVAAYLIGLVIERPQLIGLAVERPSSNISLAIFLVTYFANLWVAWLIAVRITAPRSAEA